MILGISVLDHKFEQVGTFRYLGTVISLQNLEENEIQNQLNAENRSLYDRNKTMSSKLHSCRAKQKIYRRVIRLILLYGAKTWNLNKGVEKKLITFKNQILRSLFGSTGEGDTWGF